MARNPERIDPMIELLRADWKQHPDLRLGQLIANHAGEHDVFGVEDPVIAASIAGRLDESTPFREIQYYTDEEDWNRCEPIRRLVGSEHDMTMKDEPTAEDALDGLQNAERWCLDNDRDDLAHVIATCYQRVGNAIVAGSGDEEGE